MDLRLSVEDYAKMLRNQAAINEKGGISAGAGIGISGNCLGAAASEYQKLVEHARQQIRPLGFLGSNYAGLTRFDPSTKTRVPVTQEWVDEAVAEIVRLNVEIDVKNDVIAATTANVPPFDVISESDRIWEAVRAASAV